MMLRLTDLFAVCALAVVVLLPKASVEARPALDGPQSALDWIAALQDEAFRRPNEMEPALELADGLLSLARPDWAIASLGRFVDEEARDGRATDARMHLLLATAHAERFEAAETVAEVKQVEKGCAGGEGTPTCPVGTRARASLIGGAMAVLLEKHIDPAKDPQRAKYEVYHVLHPAQPGVFHR